MLLSKIYLFYKSTSGTAESLQCYGCFAGLKNQSHAPDCPAQFGEEVQFPCSEQETHCMTMRGRVDGGMVDLYGCGGERSMRANRKYVQNVLKMQIDTYLCIVSTRSTILHICS